MLAPLPFVGEGDLYPLEQNRSKLIGRATQREFAGICF